MARNLEIYWCQCQIGEANQDSIAAPNERPLFGGLKSKDPGHWLTMVTFDFKRWL
jgi:hypothetical protein